MREHRAGRAARLDGHGHRAGRVRRGRLRRGLISVLAAGGVVLGIARYTPMHVPVISAYAVAWLFLLSGVRRVVEVGLRSEDGIRLRGLTGLPHARWLPFWLAQTPAVAAVRAPARPL